MRWKEIIGESVSELIAHANFSDHDIDTGTGGLCGMFALALYYAVPNQNPELVLIGVERDGVPMRTKRGSYYWRHAAVRIGEQYFDIEGEQKLEWLFDNYIWGVPNDTSPIVISLSEADFIQQMKLVKSAWDDRFYEKCRKLIDAKTPV